MLTKGVPLLAEAGILDEDDRVELLDGVAPVRSYRNVLSYQKS